MTATFFAHGQGDTKTISTGSYIIDMGVEPQTVANGLKPYGLVYELVSDYQVPVIWSIRNNKVLNLEDFTYNDKDYKGGPFIIEAKHLTQPIKDVISAWETKGVIGEYTTSPVDVPVYDYIITVPKIFIFNKNLSLTTALTYINNNAEITNWETSNNLSAINACSDLFVSVDAEITNAEVAGMYDFVNSGGSVFLQGKSASQMSALNPAGNALNLLSDGRLYCYDAGECGLDPAHNQNPSAPFDYDLSYGNQSIMQFLGTDLHLATEQNDLGTTETWYLPFSLWNASTALPITTQDVNPIFTSTKGAIVAYGRAYGNNNAGNALFVAGNNLNGGADAAANVAAQRLLMNLIMQTGIDQSGSAELTGSENIIAGQANDFDVDVANISATDSVFTTNCADLSITSSGIVTAATTNSRYTCDLSVVASDACGRSAYSSKTITVYPVNSAPEATADSIVTIGNQKQIIDVLSNDSDNQPDDRLIITEIVRSPAFGTVQIVDNRLEYTGADDLYIADTLSYRICDDGLPSLCAITTVYITNLLQINTAPQLNPQQFTVTAGLNQEICLEALDAEEDEMKVTVVDYAGESTITLDPDDLCYYFQAPESFTGTETMTVTVCDIRENFLCTETEVTIDVKPPNNAPIIADQEFTVMAGELNNLCVAANDPDDDGISLTSIADNSEAQINNDDLSDLCFSYKAGVSFTGTDVLTVEICDDDEANPLCTKATITINVLSPNKAPVIEDQSFTVTAGVATEVCLEASDPNDDDLELFIINNNPDASVGPSASLCLNYQSAPDFTGKVEIAVEVCDQDIENRLCTQATVTLMVEPPTIVISKALTPDGNGDNDIFFIENIESYPDNVVQVFDRWGGVVYETTGYNNDTNNWTGTNSTKETPAGTYYYIVKLPKTGELFKGYVELIK
ncbi:Ig-like domain-containing protein [Fulvivirga aurantia]|uniref:Ig-like domain-containing protein n=1 Tax=Fulvivirga aurantia TaxID=2529383 RepID=UPI001626DC1C|nr:Ig-like domain-containing protein [Fulvivirga aurantia]